MNHGTRPNLVNLAGYAVGVGLVFVATLGVYLRFWQAGASVVVWAGGSFVLGAAIGLAVALWRQRRS